MTWQDRAHKRIAALCMESWRKANKGRKRHKPYTVPEEAVALVDALGKNDEERAKAILLFGGIWGRG